MASWNDDKVYSFFKGTDCRSLDFSSVATEAIAGSGEAYTKVLLKGRATRKTFKDASTILQRVKPKTLG